MRIKLRNELPKWLKVNFLSPYFIELSFAPLDTDWLGETHLVQFKKNNIMKQEEEN